MKKFHLSIFFIILPIIFIIYFFSIDDTILNKNITPQNFKIAFIGDQGITPYSKKVLQLIKNENTSLVLHQGDFDYSDNPQAWDDQISKILGDDFPYLASIGNHDMNSWKGYKQKLEERIEKIPDLKCKGDLGKKSSCLYKGIFIILSSVGLEKSNHLQFIKQELSNNNSIWKICSWHTNMKYMQVGGKNNFTGWDVYEECRKSGAIIATAHAHSYQRTKTLIDMENQTVHPTYNDPDQIYLSNGSTFAFVSGMGGNGIENQKRCFPAHYPYGCNGEWANIYTNSQNATYGALFCSFTFDNSKNKANCYFKDIEGKIPDKFEIINLN